MDTDQIGAGFSKGLNVVLWIIQHQVRVKEKGTVFSEVGNRLRSEGDIGDKMTVHYVKVDPPESCLLNEFST